jgi:hypothetical protein
MRESRCLPAPVISRNGYGLAGVALTKLLEDELGETIATFAYPNGYSSPVVVPGWRRGRAADLLTSLPVLVWTRSDGVRMFRLCQSPTT